MRRIMWNMTDDHWQTAAPCRPQWSGRLPSLALSSLCAPCRLSLHGSRIPPVQPNETGDRRSAACLFIVQLMWRRTTARLLLSCGHFTWKVCFPLNPPWTASEPIRVLTKGRLEHFCADFHGLVSIWGLSELVCVERIIHNMTVSLKPDNDDTYAISDLDAYPRT